MIKYTLFGFLLMPCLSYAMDKDDGVGLNLYVGQLSVNYLRKEDVSRVTRHENDTFVYYTAARKIGDFEITATYFEKNKRCNATYISHIGETPLGGSSGLIFPFHLQNAATIFKKLQEWYDQQPKAN